MKYPITPEYLASCPDSIVSLFTWLEDYIINAICEQLKIAEEPNAKVLELIRQLQRGGMPLKDIETQIKRILKISQEELDKVFDDAVRRQNEYYGKAYDKLGLIQEAADVEQFAADIDAIRRQTADVMRNITQSMGFGMRGQDGSITVSSVQETYQKILDKAAVKVMSGTESYSVAIRDGVHEMTNSGLIGDWVEYRDEEGKVYHRNRVDVAVRRAVMTGVTQVSSKYTEQAAEDFDTPYREISAHRGARDVDGPNGWENHKAWQGKVYSVRPDDKYPSIYQKCGWGAVDGLEGANCRHMHFPYIEGFSERTYTDEELANIDKPPFEYQGRKYSTYEATQKQRQIERALRSVKRRMIADKADGDTEAYTADAVRYRRLNAEYEAFSKKADLPLQKERSFIQGFGPKEAKEALAISRKNGIIKTDSGYMHQEGHEADIPERYRNNFSDFEQLQLTESEKGILSDLHALSEKDGYEHINATISGEAQEARTSWMTSKVYVPDEYLSADKVKLFHSHTNCTPPSKEDLSYLTNENVKEIGVISINGDVYTVSRGDGYLVTEEEFEDEAGRISTEVNIDLMLDPDFDKWTVAQRNYMGTREQFFRICRFFEWTMRGGKL